MTFSSIAAVSAFLFLTARRLAVTLAALAACAAPLRAGEANRLQSLQILQDDYPRAFFFRSSESAAASGMPYPLWEGTFDRLMGVIGKVLEEEVPGRSRYNIDYFTRFKSGHPSQVVLLHYNGNARDPRFQRQERGFFAGHWCYYNGATILQDVSGDESISEIRVDRAELFRTRMGRYRDKNEDIGLCELDEDGKPNWSRSEQVQLLSVDLERGVLRVQRGCYGTTARVFLAGKAYAAAHVTEGPWGAKSHLMWFYNYSTRCPRDQQGRNCSEVHARELADRFAPGGELAAFDGLEFDVLTHTRSGSGGAPGRGIDFDADGEIDDGLFDGVNTYGVGVLQFLADLRRRLGDDRLIMADGHGANHQRGMGLLNGIESEGWPDLRDAAIDDWSGGLNRHLFWSARGRSPVFNFINHKFNEPTDQPGAMRRPELPMKTHRLVFAAGLFTDSAICYSFLPPSARGQSVGIWDELWMGQAHRVGWLGKPLGAPVRLASRQGDLLQGAGKNFGSGLLDQIQGEGVRVSVEQGRLKVEAANASDESLRFAIRDVPCQGPNLFVSLIARAEPLPHYPPQMPRLMRLGVSSPGELMAPGAAAGMQLRGKPLQPIDESSGAQLQYSSSLDLGGRSLPGFRVHPPYRTGVGRTYWEREAIVPDQGVLEFSTGMGEKAPGRSDGVVFCVEVAEAAPGQGGPFQQVFEHQQVESRWMPHRVQLQPWAGRRVRLRFIADAGPNDNATTDHAYWGAARIARPGERRPATRAVQFMTWADNRDFPAGFYFDAIQSDTVDLTFSVEGAEPVYLADLTLHAAADVIYREFQHGLVVANPAPQPVTLDLAELLPGARFRRLQGSPEQDPVANNGQVLPGSLTLQDKDALLLIRLQ